MLVFVAIGLLIAGVLITMPVLVTISIWVSVLSLISLLIGVILRRHELFGSGAQTAVPSMPAFPTLPAQPLGAPVQPAPVVAPGVPSQASAAAAPVHTVPLQAPQASGPAVTAPPPDLVAPASPALAGPAVRESGHSLSPDAIVLVIPGRKRYHLRGCRQVVGRDHEELTHEEAREEGFSACTTCLPDSSAVSPVSRRTVAPDTESTSNPPGALSAEGGPATDYVVEAVVVEDRPADVTVSRPPIKPVSPTVPAPVTQPLAVPRPSAPPTAGEAEDSASRAPEDTEKGGTTRSPAEQRVVVAGKSASDETVAVVKHKEADSGTTGAPEPETSGGKRVSGGKSREDRDDREVVKVIIGTRRFHSSDCPLIKGADESGIEAMSPQAAEEAGLTHCTVCQNDRQTVS
ncbi:hypothetical protein [Rhizohabitans arisaemae]|uniref:hypothetical protein n=1 Tax=Rhizohabitans arisaemae TaxID=2720610 RepID=UPI0024B19EA6|nr:hypothetical protein [Rhizohabitans arisaemae]